MTERSFFVQLFALTALVAGALVLVHRHPLLQSYAPLSWISLGFFVLLSLLMFFTGRSAASSSNKYFFTNAVLGFTIGKMMMAVLIVLAYLKLAQPATKWFILPFFGIYAVYTIFETYFMMRLSR